MKRITSIDCTRGLVMIIMALDHVRDLMHVNAVTQSPTNLATTSPALFFTRWITHFCAPTFVFLSGISVFLSLSNTRNYSDTQNFLLKRGLWLIFLDLTVFNLPVFFDIHFSVIAFSILSAFGFGFIVLSFLLSLKPKTIGIIGLIIIVCHNAFSLIPFADGSVLKMILTPLFNQVAYPLGGHTLVIGYSPIPWMGIMFAGFGAGSIFKWDAEKRKKTLIRIGCFALLAFAVIRAINIYGDSFPWAQQKNSLFTFLSFINITKYPPSLDFCLVTLGTMCLWLALFEGRSNRFTRILDVYGKVPLFYFIAHFYLIRILLIGSDFLPGFRLRRYGAGSQSRTAKSPEWSRTIGNLSCMDFCSGCDVSHLQVVWKV